MADMDPELHTPSRLSHTHIHIQAPVAPDDLAGNDAGGQVSPAGEAQDAGDPPASEAPQPPSELDDVQPTSTSTSTTAETATTVTTEAIAEREQHEVVSDASASTDDTELDNIRDINDAQRQNQQDQEQPHTGSPSPSTFASAPPPSSAALSQSLVLLTTGDDENKASTPPSVGSTLGSPSLSPASTRSPSPASPSSLAAKTRRQSPAREGTLVVSRASSRSSSVGGKRQIQAQVQRRDSLGVAVPWSLDDLPNEVLLHILGFLDVNDQLATSRVGVHRHRVGLSPS